MRGQPPAQPHPTSAAPPPEHARLDALEAAGILDTPPEPEFDALALLASRVCQAPVSLVSFVGADRQWFKARIGLDAEQMPLRMSICAFAIEAGDLLVIPDLTADARTRDNPVVTGAPRLRFYAGAVVRDPAGHALGTLCVLDHAPRSGGLSAEQADSLRILARQVEALLALRRAVAQRDGALLREGRSGRAYLGRALASEASSEQLRLAQDAGGVGSFDIDLASGQAVASDQFWRIFGAAPRDAFPATALAEYVLPEDRHLATNQENRTNGTAAPEAELRIRRMDTGVVRWIARRSAFDRDADGRPVRMRGVVQDITDRKLAEARQAALLALGDQLRAASSVVQAEAAAAAALGQALGAARAGYGRVDLPSKHVVVDADWTAPGVASVAGQYDISLFRNTIEALGAGRPLVIADLAASEALQGDAAAYAAIGVRSEIAVPLLDRGRLVGKLFVHSTVARAWSEAETAFAVAVADRTYATVAKLQAEADQRLLNQELSHRLKNTLAIVHALAAQSLRPNTPPEALKSFLVRLGALAKAHDILMQRNWGSAPLRTVIATVLAPEAFGERFDVAGPDIDLNARAVLSLSLLLHELATNALKHGALSVPSGRVTVTWLVETEAPQPSLLMRWHERHGPPAHEPARAGFGSLLIKAGLIGTGGATLAFGVTGLKAEFHAPLTLLTE